jgi:hypothetical protein
MNKISEKILTRPAVKENIFVYAAKFTVLLGLAIAAPFLNFQAVTGTIVNATLIVAVAILGKKEAIAIGIFPSLISIVAGLLVPAAVPLIPFIILSNVILIFVFDFLRKKNYWRGVIFGSILKFSFLYFSGVVLVRIFESNISFDVQLATASDRSFRWNCSLCRFAGYEDKESIIWLRVSYFACCFSAKMLL